MYNCRSTSTSCRAPYCSHVLLPNLDLFSKGMLLKRSHSSSRLPVSSENINNDLRHRQTAKMHLHFWRVIITLSIFPRSDSRKPCTASYLHVIAEASLVAHCLFKLSAYKVGVSMRLFKLQSLSLFKLPFSISGEHRSLNEHLRAKFGLK